jgi:hypothetical protein
MNRVEKSVKLFVLLMKKLLVLEFLRGKKVFEELIFVSLFFSNKFKHEGKFIVFPLFIILIKSEPKKAHILKDTLLPSL